MSSAVPSLPDWAIQILRVVSTLVLTTSSSAPMSHEPQGPARRRHMGWLRPARARGGYGDAKD
jgi:hypothetical protein